MSTMATMLLATMCQGCEAKLIENGKPKRPFIGSELKDLTVKGICHFCGRKLAADECASLIALTTA